MMMNQDHEIEREPTDPPTRSFRVFADDPEIALSKPIVPKFGDLFPGSDGAMRCSEIEVEYSPFNLSECVVTARYNNA